LTLDSWGLEEYSRRGAGSFDFQSQRLALTGTLTVVVDVPPEGVAMIAVTVATVCQRIAAEPTFPMPVGVTNVNLHRQQKTDDDAGACPASSYRLVRLNRTAATAVQPDTRLAACLDGSGPAYYFRPGVGSDSKKLLIFLQGGGWCQGGSGDCFNRSKTALGSSRSYAPCTAAPDLYEGGMGLRDANGTVSAWANWAEAYFYYCDGGSLTGAALAPDTNHTAAGQNCPNASCDGPPVFYRGHHNFVAMLDQVVDQAQPSEVLLAGGSAGGMAAFLKCDLAASMLKSKGVRVACMPDAGAFPIVNYDGIADSMESKLGLPAACVAAQGADWRRCMHGELSLAYSTTPTFVLNAMYNWCTAYFLYKNPAFSHKVAWMDGVLTSYRQTMVAALMPAWSTSTPHGIFADSCDVHVESSVDWSRVRIDGSLMKDAAARWYFNRSVEKLVDLSNELKLVVNHSSSGNATVTGFKSTNPTCNGGADTNVGGVEVTVHVPESRKLEFDGDDQGGAFRNPGPPLKSDDEQATPELELEIDWGGINHAATTLLRTRASFFIEASAMLSRDSPVHDRLWDGVRQVGAPMTMYSPWAPYPHYCVGSLLPPTNNGSAPCKTSWNMSLMDTMIDDYLNATVFDKTYSPFFEFTQSPCWFWLDGDCTIPAGVNTLSYPGHKTYASGTQLADKSMGQLADYFGRLAAWFRSGGMVDECGAAHENERRIEIKYWGVENEGEHGAGNVMQNILQYDAIIQGIRKHERGGEAPMKYLACNQNFCNSGSCRPEIEAWVRTFLNRSNHADPTVPIDVLAFHGYFHGAGNTRRQTTDELRPPPQPPPPPPSTHPLSGWHSLALAGSLNGSAKDALFMRTCSMDGYVTQALHEAKLGKGMDSTWFIAPGLHPSHSNETGSTVSFRSFPEKFCPHPGDQTKPCPFYLLVDGSTGRVRLGRDDGTQAFARAASFAATATSGKEYSFTSSTDSTKLLAWGASPTGKCAFNFSPKAGEGNLVVQSARAIAQPRKQSWVILPPNSERVPRPPAPPPAPPPPPPGVCDAWGMRDEDLPALFAEVDSFANETVDLFVSLRVELAPSIELGVSEFGVTLSKDVDSKCAQGGRGGSNKVLFVWRAGKP
jgi:hypothetical protein